MPAPTRARLREGRLLRNPRGEFASGGVVNWDKPLIEGRDASAIISWLTTAANPAKAQVAITGADAVVGMVGGSYGGAVQLGVAGTDPRVKAIVPGITWNSLLDSIYPSGAYLTSYGAGLFASLIATGARLNSQIVSSTLTGALFGVLSESDQAFYSSSGPTVLVDKITAPALLIQGTVDILFPLQQAVTSATTLAGNAVPAKLIWFCGGHGECIDPENPAQGPNNITDAMKWLDTYVAQTTSVAQQIPTFQWYDQRGTLFSSPLLPSAPNFNKGSVRLPVTAACCRWCHSSVDPADHRRAYRSCRPSPSGPRRATLSICRSASPTAFRSPGRRPSASPTAVWAPAGSSTANSSTTRPDGCWAT